MLLKRILVPVDFSLRSRVALRYAIDLARKTGADVALLHVLPAPSSLQVAVDAYLGLPMPHAATSLRDGAEEHLRNLAGAVDHEGVPLALMVEEGDAAATITQVAVDGAHDLIVLGTRGRIGLAELVSEGVARRLISCAPCPVVTLRETQAASA